MEKPRFQSTWFHGDPISEMTHLGISDSQLHFWEFGNLQSHLRPRISEFHVLRHEGTGHKLLFRSIFLRERKAKQTTCRIQTGRYISLWKNVNSRTYFLWEILEFNNPVPDLAMLEFSMNGILTKSILSLALLEEPSSRVTEDNIAVICMTFCH